MIFWFAKVTQERKDVQYITDIFNVTHEIVTRYYLAIDEHRVAHLFTAKPDYVSDLENGEVLVQVEMLDMLTTNRAQIRWPDREGSEMWVPLDTLVYIEHEPEPSIGASVWCEETSPVRLQTFR